MSAFRRLFWLRHTIVRHALLCLTVASFLARAVVPAGYMPDVSGAQEGRALLTLCAAAGGPDALWLDWGGPPDSSSGDHFGQDCPFGIVMSQAALTGQPGLALRGDMVHRPAVPASRNQARPPLPALGPPLGSRAPPSLFA